jgi:hypothetical protein
VASVPVHNIEPICVHIDAVCESGLRSVDHWLCWLRGVRFRAESLHFGLVLLKCFFRISFFIAWYGGARLESKGGQEQRVGVGGQIKLRSFFWIRLRSSHGRHDEQRLAMSIALIAFGGETKGLV